MAMPAFAGVNKAALLADLEADQSIVHGWVFQVGQMGNLGSQRTAIINDLSFASASAAELHNQALADSSPAALSADWMRFTSQHAGVTSLEGPKVNLASNANAGLAEYYMLLNFLQQSGGLDPHSPIHTQTMAMMQQLITAKTNFDQGIARLGQATLTNYPGSRGLLGSARSMIYAATAALAVVDQFVHHPPPTGGVQTPNRMQIQVETQILALNKLRTQVFADPNLNDGARTNLLQQINAGLIALGQLDRCVIASANSACAAELSRIDELGVLFLIRPKANIMLACASQRSAITKLTGLLPILRSQIAATAARHLDVTHLNSLISDLMAQLAGASADIAPIDAEFESMTASTPAVRRHDSEVIVAALATLTDANNRLRTASNDANQIMTATA